MNRNKVKKALPILQAIAEGKPIQWRDPEDYHSEWEDRNVEELNEIQIINYSEDYRIKPEPKYRPFANAEECWAEMLKHKPFGWMKDRNGSKFVTENVDYRGCLCINDDGICTFDETFENYTFADGAPFGVKVEE